MRLIVIIYIVIIAACSPKFKIQSDTPFPGNFKQYNSFKFYNPNNLAASNFAFEESDKKVIFDAVADEMKLRGYNSIQDADLIIKIQGEHTKPIIFGENITFLPCQIVLNRSRNVL